MYKVLIADDEPFVREGLKELIDWDALGFTLCGAYKDGEELLENVQSKEPDVLILDIKMPNMDGLEVARIVRERYDDIVVILLSAYSDFTYAKQAIEYQVRKYVVKSNLLEELPKALEDVKVLLDKKNEEVQQEVADEAGDSELIAKTKGYVKENLDRNMSLEEIAGAVFTNRSYLSRVFKKQTGENLFDYITKRRIEKAKEYIRQGNKKIYEIAAMVGMEDTAYFSKVFKKYVGMSPKEYEKNRK